MARILYTQEASSESSQAQDQSRGEESEEGCDVSGSSRSTFVALWFGFRINKRKCKVSNIFRSGSGFRHRTGSKRVQMIVIVPGTVLSSV